MPNPRDEARGRLELGDGVEHPNVDARAVRRSAGCGATARSSGRRRGCRPRPAHASMVPRDWVQAWSQRTKLQDGTFVWGGGGEWKPSSPRGGSDSWCHCVSERRTWSTRSARSSRRSRPRPTRSRALRARTSRTSWRHGCSAPVHPRALRGGRARAPALALRPCGPRAADRAPRHGLARRNAGPPAVRGARREGDRPGGFDMKAGVVAPLAALAALESLDGVDVLLTGDEELGSPIVAPADRVRGGGRAAALVLEPSAAGALKTERKGVALYQLGPRAGPRTPASIRNAGSTRPWNSPTSADGERARRTALGTTVTPTLVTAGTPPTPCRRTRPRTSTSGSARARRQSASRRLRLAAARDAGTARVAGGRHRRPSARASASLFRRARSLRAGSGCRRWRRRPSAAAPTAT